MLKSSCPPVLELASSGPTARSRGSRPQRPLLTQVQAWPLFLPSSGARKSSRRLQPAISGSGSHAAPGLPARASAPSGSSFQQPEACQHLPRPLPRPSSRPPLGFLLCVPNVLLSPLLPHTQPEHFSHPPKTLRWLPIHSKYLTWPALLRPTGGPGQATEPPGLRLTCKAGTTVPDWKACLTSKQIRQATRPQPPAQGERLLSP